MRQINVGDRVRGICHHTGTLEEATLRRRDITIGGKPIIDVIVAVCNDCDETIAIPQQSTSTIKKQLERHDKRKEDA